MPYPKRPDYTKLTGDVALWARLKHEYGAEGVAEILQDTERALKSATARLKRLPIDRELSAREPNALPAIRALRPRGPRRLWTKLADSYPEQLEGALLSRFAGCILGSAVEMWMPEKMKALAEENGDPFPPTDYWRRVPEPASTHYGTMRNDAYTRPKMDGVPLDDDLAYTLLGLLVAEEFGPDFTTEDIGKAWLKYLPVAYTAEEIALRNLKAGVPARKAADKDNPMCEFIGADIRSDPWGYMAPGWPERAAAMAYHDAYISHRRQGIYGEMFFSAAISAAFAVDDPVEALRIGLTEIPRHCAMANAVRWALTKAPEIRDYRQARNAVNTRFKGMHPIHTINNACLSVWGITIGGKDVTKVIGETVAMGMDNDCAAASAGSIVGAVVGKKGVPEHWYRPFNNRVHSYLIGNERFAIDDLLRRFRAQAASTFAE